MRMTCLGDGIAARRLGQPGNFEAIGAAQLVAQAGDVELLGLGVVHDARHGLGHRTGLAGQNWGVGERL